MRRVITGEQVAQLYNRDPFALPIWRVPVYQTPAGSSCWSSWPGCWAGW
jgi:hypothetical protein